MPARCLLLGLACFLPLLLARPAEPAIKRQAAPPPSAPAGLPTQLDVFPPAVELHGPRATQRLVVVATYPNGRQWEVTAQAAVMVPNGRVKSEGATLRPVADGSGFVSIEFAGLRRTVPVKVAGSADDVPLDFCREVLPVLTKQGCNQGACHGAQHGKGGFRQSLFGFDPQFDYDQMVNHLEGRRIAFAAPERSLLLRKPALEMEHGGGRRLPPGLPAYERLLAWIADGAPGPRKEEPTLKAIAVFPPQRRLLVGEKQQLLVQATWSDGRIEDVTDFAQYDSITDGQAKVAPHGEVACVGKGEGAIMVRYLGQAAVARIVAPYGDATREGESTSRHLVDRLLAAKWRDLGLAPSPPAADAEYFRRLHLDLLGTMPTPAEVKAYLADSDPEKATKLVDRLLERPEYVDFWTLKWGDLLRNNRAFLEPKGMFVLHQWLRASFRENKPFDQFVREILTAQGSTFREGPANFYRVGNNASEWAEASSQLFLGVRLQCAQCHHHPFEKWSQDDYYGMAACFSRLGTKPSQEYGLFGRETVIFLRPTGEQNHPRKGGVVKPKPPEGAVLNDEDDRRAQLADWLLAKENPYFARNIANRYWSYFMGRGLVEPIDDMRATNPASNEPLLAALAADFAANGYDVKRLCRTILTSKAYRLSSLATPGNAADAENRYHCRSRVKRLSAEQLADALDAATGTKEKYQGLPAGTRAIQLPDSAAPTYLLSVFGKPGRRQVCECERVTTPNLAQALHLLNSDFLSAKISRPGGRLDSLFKAKASLPDIIDELYLATFSRPPHAAEKEQALALIKEAPSPRVGAEDLLWALLNSPEFLFIH